MSESDELMDAVVAQVTQYYATINNPVGLIACNPNPLKAKFHETPLVLNDTGPVPVGHFKFEHKCATPDCFYSNFWAKIKIEPRYGYFGQFEIAFDIHFNDYMLTVAHCDSYLRVAIDECPDDGEYEEEEDFDEREQKDRTPLETQNGCNWSGYRLFHCMHRGEIKEFWIRDGFPKMRNHYPAANVPYQSLYDLIKAFLPRFLMHENPVFTLGVAQRSAIAQNKEHDIRADYQRSAIAQNKEHDIQADDL